MSKHKKINYFTLDLCIMLQNYHTEQTPAPIALSKLSSTREVPRVEAQPARRVGDKSM